MSKTIEELAKQFTDELFAGDDLTDFDTQTEKNNAYVMCMAFGNYLMEQPLSFRLTAEEKEKIGKAYAYAMTHIEFNENRAEVRLLHRIFDTDLASITNCK